MQTNPEDLIHSFEAVNGNPGNGAGLTKREHFAASFMVGMLAHSTRYKPHNPGTPWMECISREAINLADALISELNKETK